MAASELSRAVDHNVGNEMVFDGKVFISTKIERFAPVTLELWVYPEKPPVPEAGARAGDDPAQGIMGSDIPFASGIGIILRYGKGSDSPLIFAQYLPSGGHNEVATNTQLPVQKWSHLAVVFGSNHTTVYLNGKEIWRGPASRNAGGTSLVIGKLGEDNPRHWFTGKIRSVRISKGERYIKEFAPARFLEKDEMTVYVLDGKVVREPRR